MSIKIAYHIVIFHLRINSRHQNNNELLFIKVHNPRLARELNIYKLWVFTFRVACSLSSYYILYYEQTPRTIKQQFSMYLNWSQPYMLLTSYECHFCGIWSRPLAYKLAGRLLPDTWQAFVSRRILYILYNMHTFCTFFVIWLYHFLAFVCGLFSHIIQGFLAGIGASGRGNDNHIMLYCQWNDPEGYR